MSASANLLIEQGSDFVATVQVLDAFGDPVDLTEVTCYAQLRRSYYARNAYDFQVVPIDLPMGKIELRLSNEITKRLRPGRYVYDVVGTTTENPASARILEGVVNLTPRVTILSETLQDTFVPMRVGANRQMLVWNSTINDWVPVAPEDVLWDRPRRRLTLSDGSSLAVTDDIFPNPPDEYTYWGDPDTDGSIRFSRRPNDLVNVKHMEQRRNGSWVFVASFD